MVKRLKEEGHSADGIHGDLRQSKRDRVINSFRKGLKRILIATDVAARGLDIPLIQHVINYDLPQVPEDYVHRIGRTARAGSDGSALTFLTPDDRLMWNSINKLIDPNFKSVPSNLKRNSKTKRRGKGPNNKKRKLREERKLNFKEKRKSFSEVKRIKSRRRNDNSEFSFKKTSNFRDKRKSFGKGKSEKPLRETEKKDYSFKSKKKFFKKKLTKPAGFTNNPKYLEKQNSENLSSDGERKKFNFKGKKKFKNRKSRPKNFTFKKHNKKRK
jgi:superfamily II DNA/RNA helicase